MKLFGVFENISYRELGIVVARCTSVFYPPPLNFIGDKETLSVYAPYREVYLLSYTDKRHRYRTASAAWLPSISKFDISIQLPTIGTNYANIL